MKNYLSLAAMMLLIGTAAPASNMIRKACLKAGRDGATSEICSCIQQVANQNLSKRKDQKLAASFFKNPAKAQEIRQSPRPTHAAFWLRYKAWSGAAAAQCASEES